jgi:hypothetical protein
MMSRGRNSNGFPEVEAALSILPKNLVPIRNEQWVCKWPYTSISSEDKDDEVIEFGAAEYMKKRRVANGDGSCSGSGWHSRSLVHLL